MRLDEIITTSRTTIHEIGGYFIPTPHTTRIEYEFKHTANHQVNTPSGREYINLPTGKSQFVWHMHPKNMGGYPSFEDLTIATELKGTRFSSYVNVIVTPDHTWVLLSPKIYNSKDELDLQQIYNSEYELNLKRNYDLFYENCEWWRARKDKKALKNAYVEFAYFMTTEMGYPIRVVDNTNVSAIMRAIRAMHS